jgi:TonB family protein
LPAPAPANAAVPTGDPAAAGAKASQPSTQPGIAGAEKPAKTADAEAARDIAAAGEERSAEARKESAGKTEPLSATARKESAAVPADRQEPDKTRGVAPATTPKDNRQQEVVSASTDRARLKASQPGTNEKATDPYVFTGQVRDPQGTPLSFVNIRIRNSAASTYSDARGQYRIMSADSSLVIDLNAVGYQGRTLVLSAAHPHQQVLMQAGGEPGRARSVQPKASSREEMTRVDEADSSEHEKPEAEPTDGWGAYQYYLLNNVSIPRDAAQQKLHGTVEISFQVADNGRLSDFRVEKSLSPSCDKEAIRLLREGPAWTLYNSGKPLRARVTVVF